MRLYFDESIFESGFALRNYTTVRTYNAVDRFLASRHNKEIVTDDCNRDASRSVDSSSSLSSSDEEEMDNFNDNRIINLNPRFPCRGINVYSLNIINKEVVSTLSFHTIKIENAGDFYPIYIGELSQSGSNRFTVSDLSAIDSALMLKYFAFRAPIAISVELYLLVNRLFVDYREWFAFSENLGVIETQNHNLLLGGETVDTSPSEIGFCGDPIKLL